MKLKFYLVRCLIITKKLFCNLLFTYFNNIIFTNKNPGSKGGIDQEIRIITKNPIIIDTRN